MQYNIYSNYISNLGKVFENKIQFFCCSFTKNSDFQLVFNPVRGMQLFGFAKSFPCGPTPGDAYPGRRSGTWSAGIEGQ